MELVLLEDRWSYWPRLVSEAGRERTEFMVVLLDRGARVLERCDILRSIYGISSSPRGARNIEKCDISRSICGISNTPTARGQLELQAGCGRGRERT